MQAILNNSKITVICPQGSLNATNALELERDITTALAQNAGSWVVVDLEQVESLDSSALMALVSGLKLAQKFKRRLSVCSVSPSLKIIFELTQLDKVFETLERKVLLEDTSMSLEEATLVHT